MSNTNQASTPDFFTKLPRSRQHIISLAVLFIIPLILFFDTTLGGKELLRHDITQWRAGAQSVIEYKQEFGKEPLWATNVFSGMPAYVISLSNSVPHIDLVAKYFKKIYPAFQYWVMLAGMYVLLILLGFNPLAAVAGSIMYGLTTYFPVIIIAGHTSKFFALGLAPWLIAGYWVLSRSDKKIYGILLFTVALALQIRAGHPQITYYFFYLLGILWAFDSWNAWKSNKLKPWALVTGLLIIGGVLGILGNAERILPLQEYAGYSIRGGSTIEGTSGLNQNYAFLWSQGISETLTLIVPDLFGGSSPDYWGPKSFTSGPHYIGVISFLFILIALFKCRQKIMYLFLGTGTLAILFAWGGHFELFNALAFKYIPFFSKFRAPETWLVLTAFSYSVVAVYGIQWLLDYAREKAPSLKSFYAPFGTALGIFLVLFISMNSFDFYKQTEIDSIANQIAQQNQVPPTHPQVQSQARNYVDTKLVPERADKAKRDVLRFGLLLILGAGIIYLLVTKKISSSVAGFAVILLIGIEMIGVDRRYMPESNFVSGNVDPERYILSQKRDIDQFIQEHVAENSVYPYRTLPLLDNPFSNNIPSYFYPTVGGYTGAKLSLTQEVFMAENNPLFSGPYGINLDLLRLLNTKYLTYSAELNLPGLKTAFQGQSGIVYEIENVLPKAFFVDSVITVQTPIEAYQYLYPQQIDYARTAVVEHFEAETEPDSTSSVQITNYAAPEITIETSRSKPGFLVLSEVYYPAGWKATLDGEEIPIHKTNYFLRGIQVPAGSHTIKLSFEPKSYSMGLTLSWFSLFCQLGMAIFAGISFFRSTKDGKN